VVTLQNSVTSRWCVLGFGMERGWPQSPHGMISCRIWSLLTKRYDVDAFYNCLGSLAYRIYCHVGNGKYANAKTTSIGFSQSESRTTSNSSALMRCSHWPICRPRNRIDKNLSADMSVSQGAVEMNLLYRPWQVRVRRVKSVCFTYSELAISRLQAP